MKTDVDNYRQKTKSDKVYRMPNRVAVAKYTKTTPKGISPAGPCIAVQCVQNGIRVGQPFVIQERILFDG